MALPSTDRRHVCVKSETSERPCSECYYMLKKAYKEKNNAFKIAKTDDLLHEYKFKSLQEALDVYTDGKVKIAKNDTLTALQHALFEEVGDSLKQPQPNIVIIYSESWEQFICSISNRRMRRCISD